MRLPLYHETISGILISLILLKLYIFLLQQIKHVSTIAVKKYSLNLELNGLGKIHDSYWKDYVNKLWTKRGSLLLPKF